MIAVLFIICLVLAASSRSEGLPVEKLVADTKSDIGTESLSQQNVQNLRGDNSVTVNKGITATIMLRRNPTKKPTKKPTRKPTRKPTKKPTKKPRAAPVKKTSRPSAAPTGQPSEHTPPFGRPHYYYPFSSIRPGTSTEQPSESAPRFDKPPGRFFEFRSQSPNPTKSPVIM